MLDSEYFNNIYIREYNSAIIENLSKDDTAVIVVSKFECILSDYNQNIVDFIEKSGISTQKLLLSGTDDLIYVPLSNKPSFIFFSIETSKNSNCYKLTDRLKHLCGKLKSIPLSTCVFFLPHSKFPAPISYLETIYKEIFLSFNAAVIAENGAKGLPQRIEIVTNTFAVQGFEQREAKILSESILKCRTLVNMPGNECSPAYLKSVAKSISDVNQLGFECMESADLRENGLNLLAEVGRGGKDSAYLVNIIYEPLPDKPSLALVGKGITFDTGGINIKPSGHVENMHSDMAGAAVALMVLETVVAMKLKINLIVSIPIAENLTGNNSYLPGQVITSYCGKKVEISNTDAEGRLVLADAVAYVEKHYQPHSLITVGTLTGEAEETFDRYYAPFLCNSNYLKQVFLEASEIADENIWELPLDKAAYLPKLDSHCADIKNAASNYNAGTILAAIFISQFHSNKNWLHLDIAGTSWNKGTDEWDVKGATGYGVKLFYYALKAIAGKTLNEHK